MKPEDVTTQNLSQVLSKIAEGGTQVCGAWADRLDVGARERAVHRLVGLLGSRYADCSFENFVVYNDSQLSVKWKVTEFCDDMPARIENGGGLVFYGRPGTGKDHLMVAAMYFAVIRHGYNTLWVDGMTLAERIRANIGTGCNEKAFLDRFVNPQILAISDPIPPKGDTSQFFTDTLQRIIDRRYRRGVSTWVTMNVKDGREAEERLASPIVDRLRHNSLTLECNWESYRGRKA